MKIKNILNIIILLTTIVTFTSCASLTDNASYFNGIDVSHYQGDIKWDKVTAANKNIKYVYIKASEGKTYTDRKCAINAYGAKHNKLKVGYYHFFSNTTSGIDQFDNFLNAVKDLPMDLIPVLDIETEPKANELPAFENNICTFIYLCKKRFGVYPIIYTMPNFDKKYLSGFCSERKKWYCGRINENAIMKKCVLWQVDIQPVEGFDGKIDINYCAKMNKIRKF